MPDRTIFNTLSKEEAVKRLLVLFMIFGLLVGSVAVADAKKKQKQKKETRKVEGSYQAPATAVCAPSQTDAIGCVAVVSGAKETFLTAKVTDAHGLPVAIGVEADLDGDNSTETRYGTFCGETEEPIQIDPGVELTLWVARADTIALSRCAPGMATTGTIDITFSNLP